MFVPGSKVIVRTKRVTGQKTSFSTIVPRRKLTQKRRSSYVRYGKYGIKYKLKVIKNGEQHRIVKSQPTIMRNEVIAILPITSYSTSYLANFTCRLQNNVM